MKRSNPSLVLILGILVLFLSSCSTNQFMTRRNHQPRVKVEVTHHHEVRETAFLSHHQPNTDSLQSVHLVVHESKQNPTVKPKKTMMETMVSILFPKKKELFKPVFEQHKGQLRKVKNVEKTAMDGEQIAGLVIGLISALLAITAALMIIGMATTGNIWVYFWVGMILAICAIILGGVGRLFPFKGLSMTGLALGIVVVVALLIMLVVFTVLGIL